MLHRVVLFVLWVMSANCLMAPSYLRRTGAISSTSLYQTQTQKATTISPSSNENEYQKFIREVVDIIKATGFKTGVKRTIQASLSVDMLLIDILQNPTKYQNDGGFSIPKILKELFNKLGATYVKLGQFIASSPTLFPAEFVLEFQSCLDRGPSVPYADIKKIIESDLQKPVSAVFKSIDPVPLACASIAQVHRAVLTNGTEVVVKVRKPNVEESLKADLGFLYVGSKLLELINPDLSRLSLAAIIGDLRDSMLDELDFTKEAQNLIEFREFLRISGVVDATAPMPYVGVSSKKVLVMEYLKGVPLVDLEGIKKYSANPELTLLSALRTWALSVTNSDFYHADVHAGNLLVLEDGRVGFIDFGIVGRISDTVWQSLGQLTEAFVAEDYRGIATALVAMGATDATVDIDKFAGDLKGVVEKIMNINPQIILESYDNGAQMDARISVDERETTKIVLDIVAVAENNGLKLPREFGLLLKQALYFDRYQKLLAPAMDPLRDSRVRSTLKDELSGSSGGPSMRGKRFIDVDKLDEK